MLMNGRNQHNIVKQLFMIKNKFLKINEYIWVYIQKNNPPSNAGGVSSIPGQEAKIPHASGSNNQNIKQKKHCNKFNKDIFF